VLNAVSCYYYERLLRLLAKYIPTQYKSSKS